MASGSSSSCGEGERLERARVALLRLHEAIRTGIVPIPPGANREIALDAVYEGCRALEVMQKIDMILKEGPNGEQQQQQQR